MIITRSLPVQRSLKFMNHTWWRSRRATFNLILLLVGIIANLGAADLDIDITGTSLDQLMAMTVTSVSKKDQPVQQTAAAVYVLTNEDIRRAGVTSIPDALRLVPGVQVAQVNAGEWAVGIRGFGTRSTNNLLVLIDGRAVYNPLFAGVFWEVQDVLLEDIERIEVIRGPGGAVWGANAVNGVINIITKSARDTTGGLITTGMGTEERGFVGARYGMQLDDNRFLRIYSKYFDRDEGYRPGGSHDDAQVGRLGFRLDDQLNDQDDLTLWGNMYQGGIGEDQLTAPGGFDDIGHSGVNLQASWQRQLNDNSRLTLQSYLAHTEFISRALDEIRDTVDLELEHHFQPVPEQDIVWGLGYRFTTDTIDEGVGLDLDPDKRGDHLFSAFIQDAFSFLDKAITLTLGSKIEHNDYTGIEVQPAVSIAWSPNDRMTWWSSVARAVRTPSRLEADFVIPNRFNPVIRGSRDMDSEELVAWEVGYRVRPHRNVMLDLATYFNDYDKLITLDNGTIMNKMQGSVYGIDGTARWQIVPAWRLETSYALLQMDLDVDATSNDAGRAANLEGGSPSKQLSFRSVSSLSRTVEFDWGLRYSDDLPALNVPAYLVADIRLGWKIREHLEFSVVARNLLDNHHPEQGSATTTEVQESVYGKITWRF